MTMHCVTSLLTVTCLISGYSVNADITDNRTCAFNPCSVVGSFCSNGGLCSLNQTTCLATCECTPGFSGNMCQLDNKDALSNSSSHITLSTLSGTSERSEGSFTKCAFNPCLVSNYCENYGTCSLDTDTCAAKCECPTDFTGNRCQNGENKKSESDTTTETAKFCTFNPCISMPNFCFNNGTCSIDSNTCMATCACPSHYHGNRCEHRLDADTEAGKPSTAETPRVCAFDPCTWSSEFCKNDGVCNLDKSTCLAYCTCKEGYSGDRCESTNSTTPVTPTAGERVCAFDICTWSKTYCKNNGTCFLDKTTCMANCRCENGSSGNRCENKLTTTVVTTTSDTRDNGSEESKCNINVCSMSFIKHCFNDGECNFNESSCKATCKCSENYTGDRCETRITEEVTDSGGGNETVTESPIDQAYNICRDDASERTDEERTCNAAFQCVYGVCRVTYKSSDRFTGFTHKCICDPGAKGTFCEEKCCLDCGPNGRCHIHESLNSVTESCFCNKRYDGEFCDVFVPEPLQVEYTENTWYLWVVGLCVGTFVVLLLLAVIVPYWMWTHRVILIMKIVHYFQGYEDADDKEYDAFVSYKADEMDERFVVQVLYPKLEKELGFKLCLHFRDFVPGETISNNIINAVEGSRRTILVLTPRYIQSEFTRFEYQKAQEEMIKRKHRIIPIVLEDISECKQNMDKNLKGIIGSVTYLEWPTTDSENKNEKFWKRLQLSMPKKKVLENISSEKSYESGHTDSTLVTSNIYSNSYELDNQNVYTEIGEVDGNTSPIIRPLSEKEELELINSYNDVGDTSQCKEGGWTILNSDDDKNSVKLSQSKLKDDLMINLDALQLDLTKDIKSNETMTIELKDDNKDSNTSEYIV